MKTFTLWIIITGLLTILIYVWKKDSKDNSVTLKIKDWKDARWLIYNAMASIDMSYEKGSVRHNEMIALHKELEQQLKEQVGKEYDT
jgi:hypothetical protein